MNDTVTLSPQSADRLRSAREAAGLSQQQLAQLVNVSQHTIANLEREGGGIATTQLSEFAVTLGVRMSWIVEGADRAEANSRYELAARELRKLSSEEQENLFKLLESLR